jgi:beta-mannosidase
MGFMYWVFNDIWPAPTASTIEYGLRWKMSHYYVRHMYAPVYPIATLTPYLANIADETAQVSFYVVNDLHSSTRGELVCGIYTLDTFASRLTFGRNVSFTAPDVQRVMNIQYSLLMKRANCTNVTQCIIHCSFVISESSVGQTLFLNRPKNHQLYNPNLKIKSITAVSDNDFNIVISANRPALFVWLDVPANLTGYFSQNGFHMFQPTMKISFHSWAPISVLHLRPTISLYDVTQP